MKFRRLPVLFYLGGMVYCAIELLWRRRTHGSMFVLGGLCFVTLGELGRRMKGVCPALRGLLGTGIITVLELICGIAVNQDYSVWDYRQLPLNYRGQICLPFFIAWIPLGLLAMWLYDKTELTLAKHKP